MHRRDPCNRLREKIICDPTLFDILLSNSLSIIAKIVMLYLGLAFTIQKEIYVITFSPCM